MPLAISISGTNKSFGGDEVFIVAEIGKNFIQTEDDRPVAEYLRNARELVDAAVASGADAVKFQTHEVEDEVLDREFTAPHFKVPGGERYKWVTRNTRATPLEDFWKPLKRYCDERGIIFFSTPMSRQAAQKLDRLGVPFWKVGSGDVQDYVLLDYLAESGKPIIISSGMVSLQELDEVIKHLRHRGAPLAVLYCVSQYPCPVEYFNLATIESLTEKYPEVIFGFSDHSVGDHAVDLAAVKLGAKIIEKHLSLSRDLWGSDHKVSLTPTEFKRLVDAVRLKEHLAIDERPYYGVRDRELEGADNLFRPYFNKTLVAGDNLPKGTVITKEVIFAMRPKMLAGGFSAMRFYDVLGKRINKGLKKYDPITAEILYDWEA